MARCQLHFEIFYWLVVKEYVLGNVTRATIIGSISFVIHIPARIKMLAINNMAIYGHTYLKRGNILIYQIL